MKHFLILLLFSIHFSSSTINKVTNEFIILLISQPHIYILSQVHNASTYIPAYIPLLYTHSYASTIPNWYAIYPIFSSIINQYPQLKWLFICEPQTRMNLTELIAFTETTKDNYIGHGLYDSEPSIIHHYSLSFDNPYPDFSSGVLISRNILSLFINHFETYTKKIDFIIDIKYELNQLINELTNTKLIDRSDLFCNHQYKNNCLTWYDGQYDYLCQRKDIQLNDLYIGIKTFIDYHQNRINLLKKTWLNNKLNYNLFTNEINKTIDNNKYFIITKENTERGHCHKTFTILNYFYKNKKNFKYLIIVDDDTLISIQRILNIIRCFILSNDSPIVLGERYGYGEYYDYPTGGSGMIFNRQAVQEIISNCECPTPDAPDDMILGLCLKRINIPLIHIPELHQAQPNAYSKDWLQHQKPISFHKFEGINVEEVYQTYLHEDSSIPTKSHYEKDEF